MSIKYSTHIVILVCTLFSGCAITVSQSNLYWGNYSHTLYEMKKTPNEQTKQAHIAELENIIAVSNNQGLRVPPGVYTELGMHVMERGDENRANSLFNKEAQIYPESSVLIKLVLSK